MVLLFVLPMHRFRQKAHSEKAGWLGKGKDTHAAQAKEHTSRPLSSLKDPDSFGPPPKNVTYNGGAAVSNAITPDRRGLGAPLRTEELVEQGQEPVGQKPPPPPVPYRANRTGINTNNLPKPPVRRTGNDNDQQSPTPSTKPKPSLPPRLPPRQNSHPTELAPESPPTYTAAMQAPSLQDKGSLNQGALGRLGRAGVSVPGFGIGPGSQAPTEASQTPNPSPDQPSNTSPTATAQAPSLSNLGSHFSKLSTAAPPPTSTPTPSQGTSMQQKQDALRTAAAFRNDPASISLSDARGAASTANNFRERHGDQVVAGGRWAGAMNNKYDVANRVNGLSGGGTAAGQEQASSAHEPSPWANEPSQGGLGGMVDGTSGTFKRTPPPPPAGRKPGVASPPPVPLGSKPRT